jgi:tRNA(Ile)-lysidine synthase
MRRVLEQQIRKRGIRGGETLLVAVSGGIDSVVLLDLLNGAAPRFGFRLQVAHLDHQLRPQSAADARFVAQLCAALGIPCHVEVAAVLPLAKKRKLSLETAAREVRREFLQRTAGQLGARLIALAHQRGDQAETFLQRLLRGSGTAGLGGMRPLREVWWRPLLDCSREQILAYAGQNDLVWVEDQSNADPAYLRNRLRHQLLPDLRTYNPQVEQRLAELCRQLQVEEDFWAEQVGALFPDLLADATDGLRLFRQGLLRAHPALRLRLFREALRRVRGDLQRIEAAHLYAMDRLLVAGPSQAQLDLPGCWLARRYETLWLRQTPAQILPAYELKLSIPGELELPCGRVLLASLQEEQGGESARVAEFARDELSAPLRVRSWRPGDRFAPAGMAGHKQLKEFFSDQKIELEERARTPLLTCGEEILWVVGKRRSQAAVGGRKTGPILRLELV